MKRILITGANSYLGKSLTEYLKQWPDEFQVEATSVRDDTWKETDFHFFDAIYHTAALVHPSSPAILSPESTSPLFFSSISKRLDFTVIMFSSHFLPLFFSHYLLLIISSAAVFV